MKIPIGTLFAAQPALAKLASQGLPIRASYAVARVLTEVQREIAVAEEVRVNLVRKYGGPEENGQVSVRPEHLDQFLRDMTELNSTDVDIARSPIPLSLLEGAHLAPADLMALESLLETEDDRS